MCHGRILLQTRGTTNYVNFNETTVYRKVTLAQLKVTISIAISVDSCDCNSLGTVHSSSKNRVLHASYICIRSGIITDICICIDLHDCEKTTLDIYAFVAVLLQIFAFA